MPRTSHTAMPNFKGKEKQILQMPERKCAKIIYLGGGGGRWVEEQPWALARAWSGWVKCRVSQESKLAQMELAGYSSDFRCVARVRVGPDGGAGKEGAGMC